MNAIDNHSQLGMDMVLQQLKDLLPGESAIIKGYENASPAYRQRLISMGLTPHTQIRVVRRAPLGDPIEIEVRGSLLSLRQFEASCIQLEKN